MGNRQKGGTRKGACKASRALNKRNSAEIFTFVSFASGHLARGFASLSASQTARKSAEMRGRSDGVAGSLLGDKGMNRGDEGEGKVIGGHRIMPSFITS